MSGGLGAIGQVPSDTGRANGDSKFRAIVEIFADWIWELDANGSYTQIGPRAHDVLGYDSQELIGKRYFDLVAPADAERARAAFESISRQRKPFWRVENKVLSKCGMELIIESSGIPVFGEDGTFTGYIGADRDITAQKRAQQELREEEAQFRGLVEQEIAGICMLAADGTLAYVNPRFAAMFGYAPDEVTGHPFTDFIADADRETVSQSFRERLEGIQSSGPSAFAMKRRDGSLIDVLAQGTLAILRGRPAIVAVILDITEQKKSEAAIAESELRLRTVLATARDGITLIDIDTEELVFVNPAFREMLGYSEQESRALRLKDCHPPEALAAVRREFQRNVKGDTGGASNVPMRRKNGSIFLADITGSPITYAGHNCIVGVLRDVTEAKRAEAALRLSEAQLSNALAIARAGHWEYDVASDRFTFNDNFYRIFHTTAERVGGYTMSSAEYARRFVHPEEIGIVAREVQAAVTATDSSYTRELEHRIVYADGTSGYIAVRFFIVKDDEGRTVRTFGVNQDITERKQNENVLRRVNRALRMLSSADAVLVHATDEQKLLDDMCKVIVEDGGFPLAWIGFAENDIGKSVRPAACAGTEFNYLQQLEISWADVDRGRGPTGTAIRTGSVQINRDFGSNPSVKPWRSASFAHGLTSSISLPLGQTAKLFGALTIYARETDAFNADEIDLLKELAGRLSYGIAALRDRRGRETAVERLQRSLSATVTALASTVESRDPYTAGHQHRVSLLAGAIAREMGVADHDIQGIFFASVIHDIGKIRVPSDILNKPGKLTPVEFELIKSHVEAGYDIVKAIDFPWPVGEMILQHHERLDGSGYPNGLKADAILLGAKILAIADVVEAMMSHRPYRAALGLDTALAEIENGKGRLFDPAAVDACVALFRQRGFNFQDVQEATRSHSPTQVSR